MLTYIRKLLDRGEMAVVEREVDPQFELAAVVERSQAESERPILFKKVNETSFPVVSTVFGSHARVCELLGTDSVGICRRWLDILQKTESIAVEYGEFVPGIPRIPGKISDLPAITWREKDQGPYITAG